MACILPTEERPDRKKYDHLTYQSIGKAAGCDGFDRDLFGARPQHALRVYDMNEQGVLGRLMTGGSDGTLIVSEEKNND